MLKKWFLRLLTAVGILIAAAAFWAWRNGRDRQPGYSLDVRVSPGQPAPLRVGFAKRRITPIVADTWVDADKNAQFDPKTGDTWADGNDNGQFDPIWMAGFQNRRPAQGVHDELWARVMIVDDGKSRVAIAALDLIGFGHDNVVRVRQQIPASAGITYAMVGSTHVHAGPDMLGIWGGGDYSCGLNPAYTEFVIRQTAEAIAEAAAHLRPARLTAAEDPMGARHLVADTRDPQVFDQTLRCLKAVDAAADTTLGTLVVWGNHPETTWNKNLLLTSDFPHYVRESIEKGIFRGDSLRATGLGGTVVYLSGAIGGLMTTHPDLPVRDTFSGQVFVQPDFEKARAQGEILALLAMQALRSSTDTLARGSLGIQATTFRMPLGNPLFRLAVALNIFQRGYTGGFGQLRSEAAVLTLGDWSFVAIPGEIYPEILYGGIETPPGADFGGAPVETPPLLAQMPGRRRFVLGLMNDELGYIIPKSEWDSKAPWLYGASEQLYGEINSCGPESGPIIYRVLRELSERH